MKVLKFGAIWCPACLIMKSRWQEIEKELTWLETEYYDIDENADKAKEYNITEPPVFIFLDKNNKEFKRINGEISRKKLIKLLEKNCEK